MRILLVNPPHTAIGSRIPHEHLPPLGLLSIGDPLIDAGHPVELLDGEFGPLSASDIVDHAAAGKPDAVLLGHSGSTSAHPTVVEMQLRPRALARLYGHPDRSLRAAMEWYYRIGRRVWPYEIWHFMFGDRRTRTGPSLAAFQNPGQVHAEATIRGSVRSPVPAPKSRVHMSALSGTAFRMAFATAPASATRSGLESHSAATRSKRPLTSSSSCRVIGLQCSRAAVRRRGSARSSPARRSAAPCDRGPE